MGIVGTGMVGTSLRMAQLAVGCALLGGDAAAGAGRAVVGAATDAVTGAGGRAVSVLRTATDVVVEAVGGPPARRASTHGDRHWVEVRGLGGPHADTIGAEVLRSLRAVPGVTHVALNRPCARVVVTTDREGTSRDVAAVVADAERRALAGRRPVRQRPHTLPADDAVLVARGISAAAATVGLGLSITGNVMRLPGVPDVLSVLPTVADHVPRLRRQVERRLGREGADLLLSLLNAASAALTVSPTTAAAETAARAMLVVEAWDARQAWRRHESELSAAPAEDTAPNPGVREFEFGPVERYANRVGWVGLVAATLIGAVSRNPMVAGSAALVTAPKPSRASREAFSIALTRGLTGRHDAVVVRPRALRALDRVDAVVIDPRVLYTDEMSVSRILGVADSQRASAWEAVRAALREGRLEPGWHRLSRIRGAGRSGKALISPVRDPLAAALVAEARRTRPRVVSLDDDGLRSLAQGFDRLHPVDGSLDEALAAAVAALKADGATVLLLTASTLAHTADFTVGLVRGGEPAPWGADVFVRDLESVWRIVHALPAARSVAARGVRLSVSTSTIGALMLIPGVAGRGPEPVNVGVIYALFAGFRSGTRIFTDSMPEPETAHDWHALPVDEVLRLLPRPAREDPADGRRRSVTDVGAVRAARRVTVWSAHLARDFAAEMRSNLADPITPLLATGAAASALLGSPLDAALVGGVLLANAALSAQQQLHAERILRRLMAVQDPLARRRIGSLEDGRQEKVPAGRLRVGDVIEVHPDEVVPADARLISASNVEVDESTLTGESLPVAKRTEATPGAPLAERACMLYDGSTLVAGTALAVVTAVGSRTEMRRAMTLAPGAAREIGLHRQLARITRRALPFSVSGGALVGLLSLARGTPLREAVGSAVALTVAAVPEGLPLVATLAQLAAARRLTGESVLIRNAHSVEALARLQVVCFDKTGTLSENRLRVRATRPAAGWTDDQVLDAALSTTFARPGHRAHHATDDAIRRAVHGDAEEAAAPVERDAFLPFQAGRPFAAAVRGTRLTIKGAPEILASALTESNGAMTAAMSEMAGQGLRVLAVAERRLTADEAAAAATDAAAFEALCRSQLTPIGLLGLADTPRDKARSVLEQLSARGIGVRLITGDHPVTAAVVAREVGLEVTHDQVITGTEWERLSAEERADAVLHRRVFARMSPEHKIDVVQTLERSGVVTAMVGDGANDAAAIRAASVGIGVASRGSDPARTAADMLLLDGRIEALIGALDEGQQLWRRVQSAVSMLLGGNTGEIAFALITSVVTGRSVLNARQMLLVNMLTDALPAAALAVSPQTSSDTVDRDEAAMWRAIGIRGAATTLGATLAWSMARVTGTPRRASTVALIGLVSTQLAQTLADSHGPLVVLTALGSFAVLAALISIPVLSQVFGCTPVGPLGWTQALLATVVAGVAAALVPDLLARSTDAVRRRLADDGADEQPEPQSVVTDGGVVLDDDDTSLDQHRVQAAQGRSQQVRERRDHGVRAGGAGEVSHDPGG